MEKMHIQSTATTPRIDFNPETGEFEISGKSLPENSYDFFQPLHDFVEKYSVQPAPQTHLIFKLEYFNTSSTSHFLKLMKRLERVSEKGSNASVTWYYDSDDDDMRDAGEDFKLLSRLPIEIIATSFGDNTN